MEIFSVSASRTKHFGGVGFLRLKLEQPPHRYALSRSREMTVLLFLLKEEGGSYFNFIHL